MGETVAEGANYEYRCENVIGSCTTVVTGSTVESTTALAEEHITLHHGATKVTAETISDNVNPILVR